MIRFDGSDPLEEFIGRFPMCEAVLEDIGVSLDDRGLTVAEAIATADRPPDLALAQVACSALLSPEHSDEDWSSFALDELVGHIETHHHSFTRLSLARLDAIIAVLKQDDGPCHPLRETFLPFKHMILCHLEEEENRLFPQCRMLEHDARNWLREHKDLRQITTAVNRQHDEFSDHVEELLNLCYSCTWPSEYTEYQHAFNQGLETLAGDLAIHAHLEYEYLIPSALHQAKLERSRVESQIQRQQRKESADMGPDR